MPNIFHHYQPSTTPPKALPPYQFTVAAFTPTTGPNSQPLKYAASDISVPPKALPPYQFAEPSWEASHTFLSVEQWCTLGDLLTAPPLKPPALVTIDNWLATIGAKVFGFGTFAPGDTYTAPARVLPAAFMTAWFQEVANKQVVSAQTQYAEPDFVAPAQSAPALVQTASWFQEVARTAVVMAKVFGDIHTAPVLKPVTTAAVVNVSSWLRDAVLTSECWSVLGDSFTSPPLSAPAVSTVADWLANVGQNAVTTFKAMGDLFVSAPRPLVVAALSYVASWYCDACLSVETYAVLGDVLTYPPILYTPVPAQVTLDHWLQLLANNALPAKYNYGDRYTAPDKVIPFVAPLVFPASWFVDNPAKSVQLRFAQIADALLHGSVVPIIGPNRWQHNVNQAAVILQQLIGDFNALSLLPQPPAPITLDHWLQLLAPNSLPPTYAQGDRYTAPDKALPTITVETVNSWLQYLAANAVLLKYAQGDKYTAPDRVIPPAPITLDDWIQLLAANAQPPVYVRGDTQTKPEATLPTLTTETINSWLQYLAQNAIRLTYSAGDRYTAPDKVIPPAPITIANWLATIGLTAVRLVYAQTSGQVSPDRLIPFIAPSILAGWTAAIVNSALPQSFARIQDAMLHGAQVPVIGPNRWQHHLNQAAVLIETILGDMSVFPVVQTQAPTVSAISWLQYIADRVVQSAYTSGDRYTAPDKVQPPAAITVDDWLSNDLFSVFMKHLPGDVFTKPDATLPTLTVESVNSWLQYLAANAVLLKYAQGDRYTAPDKVIPPAPITIADWIQLLANNNQPQDYAQSDTYIAPSATLPTLPSLIGFLQQLAANAVALPHVLGDRYTAPDKVIPTLTIMSWLGEVGQAAKQFVHAQGDIYTAPDKVIPTLTLMSWLGEIGQAAKQFVHAQGDIFTKPDATLPPAPITINHWLDIHAGPAVRLAPIYWPGDTYSAPDKVIPTVVTALVAAAFSITGELVARNLSVTGQLGAKGMSMLSRLIAQMFKVTD